MNLVFFLEGVALGLVIGAPIYLIVLPWLARVWAPHERARQRRKFARHGRR